MIWTLRYGLIFLAAALGVGLAVRLMGTQTTSNIITTLHLAVPAMIAALVEGMQYARTNRAEAPRAATWRWAVVATVLATSLAVVLAYGARGMAPAFAGALGAEGMARNLVVLAGVYLLVHRFLFAFGIKSHLTTMRGRGEIE